jgi:hypothetical protein
MNMMMMMAMAVAMSHRSNASSTVQTVLGASDSLGQTGRLAVGMIRQRSDEQERAAADKRVGQELLALLTAAKIPVSALTEYPSLQRVATAAGAVIQPAPAATTGQIVAHSHTTPILVSSQSLSPLANKTALSTYVGPINGDAKYVMAERAGTFDGLARMTGAADHAAAHASQELKDAQAKLVSAEAEASAAHSVSDKAEAEAKAAPADVGKQEKAAEAKKKCEELEGIAEKARVHVHRLQAIATSMRSAADTLRAELAEVC